MDLLKWPGVLLAQQFQLYLACNRCSEVITLSSWRAAHTWGLLHEHFKHYPSLLTYVHVAALEIPRPLWLKDVAGVVTGSWPLDAVINMNDQFVCELCTLHHVGVVSLVAWDLFSNQFCASSWGPGGFLCPGPDLQGSLTSLSGLSSISSWPFCASSFVWVPASFWNWVWRHERHPGKNRLGT